MRWRCGRRNHRRRRCAGLVALVRKNCHLEALQFRFAPQDVQLIQCWQEIQLVPVFLDLAWVIAFCSLKLQSEQGWASIRSGYPSSMLILNLLGPHY